MSRPRFANFPSCRAVSTWSPCRRNSSGRSRDHWRAWWELRGWGPLALRRERHCSRMKRRQAWLLLCPAARRLCRGSPFRRPWQRHKLYCWHQLSLWPTPRRRRRRKGRRQPTNCPPWPQAPSDYQLPPLQAVSSRPAIASGHGGSGTGETAPNWQEKTTSCPPVAWTICVRPSAPSSGAGSHLEVRQGVCIQQVGPQEGVGGCRRSCLHNEFPRSVRTYLQKEWTARGRTLLSRPRCCTDRNGSPWRRHCHRVGLPNRRQLDVPRRYEPSSSKGTRAESTLSII